MVQLNQTEIKIRPMAWFNPKAVLTPCLPKVWNSLEHLASSLQGLHVRRHQGAGKRTTCLDTSPPQTGLPVTEILIGSQYGHYLTRICFFLSSTIHFVDFVGSWLEFGFASIHLQLEIRSYLQSKNQEKSQTYTNEKLFFQVFRNKKHILTEYAQRVPVTVPSILRALSCNPSLFSQP